MPTWAALGTGEKLEFDPEKFLDVLYVCDVIIKINVRYVIINRFLRYIQ